MYSTLLTLGLASLASAAPTTRQVPNYPPTSSQAFVLVANVTNPTLDFTPSINGWLFQGYHTGAALNAAVLVPHDASANPGRIFYLNGTAEEVRYHASHILTDGGTPPFPYGIGVQSPAEFDAFYPTEHDVTVNGGQGTTVYLADFPTPYPTLVNGLGQGTFVACNNTLQYYQEKFITINYAYATFEDAQGNYGYNANVPEGCVPIALLPQCAVLNELPEGSYSSHEFAQVTRCYEDVAAIDWPLYGP